MLATARCAAACRRPAPLSRPRQGVFDALQGPLGKHVTRPSSSTRLSSRRKGSGITTGARAAAESYSAGATGTPTPPTLPPPKVLEYAIGYGATKASYSIKKSLVLAFLAGAQIALGGLLMTMVSGGTGNLSTTAPGIQKLVAGSIGLPTGLMLVYFTGGELFTGNVFVMTAAWLEKKITGMCLIRNWAVSFFGNFLGASFITCLAFIAHTTAVSPWLGASVAIATAKVSYPFMTTFVKGILCNWLVCTAVWMAMASQSTAGKLLGIWVPVSMFATLGFEHSVANMFLIPQGILNGAPISVSQFLLNNLLPTTLGNIVGGAALMGATYWYAHTPANHE